MFLWLLVQPSINLPLRRRGLILARRRTIINYGGFMSYPVRSLVARAVAVALASTAWLPSSASAADTNSSGDGTDTLPEVVVTAQFVEQNVQDTPLAITAISGDMLEKRSQTDISEVARQAPSVTLAAQNQEYASGLIAYIRGIGQNDPNFAVEPGVGIYIDDVYLPTLTGSLLDLMDVSRVEILRGPQGTLAGRNSIGGAIKMYSVRPRGDDTGSFSLTYGSYDRLDLRGIYDVGLTDTLAMRISGVSKNETGYIKRLDYALTHPGSNVPTQAHGLDPVLGHDGGVAIAAGKVAFRWQPNSSVDVNFSTDFTRERNDAGVSTLLYANAAGVFNSDPNRPWLRGTDGNTIPYNCMFVPSGQNSCDTLVGYDRRYVSYATFADLYPGDSQSPYKPLVLDPHRDMDNWGTALSVDWQINDTLSLLSITSYRDYVTDWSYDVDGAPLTSNLLNQTQTNEQISQELRLSGKAGMVDYTVGGFYFDSDGFYTARVDIPYGGLDFIHGPDPTPATNSALFANATANLSEQLHLTAGIRQSWDKKKYKYLRHNPDYSDVQGPCNFFLGAPTAGPTDIGNQPNCLLFGVNGTTALFKKSRTDWRVALDYRFTEDFMAYGQVATGYRAGGFNARPYFPSQATPHIPETITSYEVGFKSDFFDNKLRVNAAGFFFDYNNIVLLSQVCADLPANQQTPCLRPSNVGSAEVQGVELEAFFYPTRNFSVDASVSLLDFQYKEINETAGTGVSINDITPYTPKQKVSLGVQYDVDDVWGGRMTFRVDASYQSEVFTEAGNVRELLVPNNVANPPGGPFGLAGGGGPIPVLKVDNLIDGYTLANARISWESGESGLGVAFEIKNLFDKYYLGTKVNDAYDVGHVYGSPGKPRTFAVTVTKDFF
jgi:iron complex outermembrane recepter protein